MSVILSTATRLLLPVLLVFSIFILIRGHHEPGGGFVGGLVASMAFALYTISNGVVKARTVFPSRPNVFIIGGLLTSLSSGVYSLLFGLPGFTGVWGNFKFPVLGYIGTPIIFDVGVYMVVLGITTGIIFTVKIKE